METEREEAAKIKVRYNQITLNYRQARLVESLPRLILHQGKAEQEVIPFLESKFFKEALLPTKRRPEEK